MNIRSLLIAGALTASVAGAAVAQHGPMMGQGMKGEGMRGMGMMGMGMGMMSGGCPMGGGDEKSGRMGMMMGHQMMGDPEKMAAMIGERLADLKSELGIGEKQKDAWEAYAKAAKDRVTMMQGMHEAMMRSMKEDKAVERMEVRISVMQNMLDSMNAMLPATKALYEVLPDDKKSKADSLLGGCGMM